MLAEFVKRLNINEVGLVIYRNSGECLKHGRRLTNRSWRGIVVKY